MESSLLAEKAFDMLSNAICGKTSLRQGTFIRDLLSKLLKFSFFVWRVEFWKLASTSVPVLRGQHSNLFASVNRTQDVKKLKMKQTT